ncbi:MAG: IS5 family transposase [Actinomycetota bacterium]|nr:IS5 family transposase [Actinomycetota bacterium]
MQGNSKRPVRKRASTPDYVSPNQLILLGFETPFEQKLTSKNRWVKLAHSIPWDRLVNYYDDLFPSKEGRPAISGRVILGAVIIKHLGDLTDRETVAQIQENMFMQYFLGYSSFTNEEPFSDTLFVEIRKRLSIDLLGKINEAIALYCLDMQEAKISDRQESVNKKQNAPPIQNNDLEDNNGILSADTKAAPAQENIEQKEESSPPKPNKGKLLMDATVAPQNITFPTDLKLLNAARKKSEQLIDILYDPLLHSKKKVRTYREIARKYFLNAAKKKRKTAKEIYKGNGRQLRFLKRNLAHIDVLLAAYKAFPLKHKDQKYLMVLHTVYQQQEEMHRTRTHRIEYRIVNIHQPHVRPIVRGKENAKTEFGSKLQMSLVEGFAFIDHLSWEAFNEGKYLIDSVEKYKSRFGFYPAEVLADQIYCTRENRTELKLLDIKLIAKPLGRPSAQAVKIHLSPGERNPIEGKFGQAKVAYGLNKIRAKLSSTSTSWIAAIALVLNLVKLMRQALVCLIFSLKIFEVKIFEWLINIQYKFNVKKPALVSL